MWTENHLPNMFSATFVLGDYKFRFCKHILSKKKSSSYIEITDYGIKPENEHDTRIMINLIPPYLLKDNKRLKEKNKQNIAELKEFCKFVLKELE
jgi:hypothetical protein